MHLNGSRIFQALNLNRYESVKVLLRICRWQNYLDGSNNYWAAISQTETFLMDRESVEKLSRQIQKSRWIENAIRSIEKRRKKGLIDVKLSSLIKRSFQREENTKRWMQTSKLLKHRSNQHVKLSKTSLNQKKKKKKNNNNNNANHSLIQNTHTHTLNKSNRFYISKTS